MRSLTGLLAATLLFACVLTAGAQAPDATAAPDAAAHTLVTRNAAGDVVAEQPHPEADILLYQPRAAEDNSAPAPSPLVQLLGMVVKLGAVLVLAYVGMMALKKYYAGGSRPTAGHADTSRGARAIQVLETAPLGQGRNVHLVAVGQQVYVVGAAAQQVTLLGEVTTDPEVQALLVRGREQGATPFQQVLGRLLPAQPAPPAQEIGQ